MIIDIDLLPLKIQKKLKLINFVGVYMNIPYHIEDRKTSTTFSLFTTIPYQTTRLFNRIQSILPYHRR